MNSRTKKILILSIISVTVSAAACLFLLYQISAQGKKLESFLTILNDQSAQEESYVRISRLVQDTEDERNTMASAFFKDESDSIGFLGDIESLASAIGLTLTTDSLNKTTAEDKTEHITMTFTYRGKKEVVQEFTTLLEHVPYHSWIDSLFLQAVDDTTWEGTATIHITIATP
jgi:hypothetical protein